MAYKKIAEMEDKVRSDDGDIQQGSIKTLVAQEGQILALFNAGSFCYYSCFDADGIKNFKQDGKHNKNNKKRRK